MAARGAHVEMTAEGSGPAERDGRQRALLIETQRAPVLERAPMSAHDLAELEAWASACGALVVRRHGDATLSEDLGIGCAEHVQRALGAFDDRARDLRVHRGRTNARVTEQLLDDA